MEPNPGLIFCTLPDPFYISSLASVGICVNEELGLYHQLPLRLASFHLQE